MRLPLFNAAGWVAMLACVALPLASAGEKVELTEIEWQAVTLVKLLPYVTWPETSLPEPDTQITVGILGDDPVSASLQELARQTKAHGRNVRVTIVDSLAPPGDLQVLFVPANRLAEGREFSKKLDHHGVLTIGASEEFTRAGGVFNFRLRDRKLIVNLQNVSKAGLVIDSKLLRLCIPER